MPKAKVKEVPNLDGMSRQEEREVAKEKAKKAKSKAPAQTAPEYKDARERSKPWNVDKEKVYRF